MGPIKSSTQPLLLFVLLFGVSTSLLAQSSSATNPDGPICYCNAPTNYIVHSVNVNPDCDETNTYLKEGQNFCSSRAWGPPNTKPTCCRIPENTLVIWGECDITGPQAQRLRKVSMPESASGKAANKPTVAPADRPPGTKLPLDAASTDGGIHKRQ